MEHQPAAGKVVSLSVHILDKTYQVACPENERAALIECADYLDKKMRKIRDSGKVVGMDRIAVMAALNIANDLLIQGQEQQSKDEIESRLRSLRLKLDAVLDDSSLE